MNTVDTVQVACDLAIAWISFGAFGASGANVQQRPADLL